MLPDLADLAALTAWGTWRTLTHEAYADHARFPPPMPYEPYTAWYRTEDDTERSTRQQPPWDGRPIADTTRPSRPAHLRR